jgi:hypothetical protein
MDGEVISAIITAIATVFIAWFTGTLWQIQQGAVEASAAN